MEWFIILAFIGAGIALIYPLMRSREAELGALYDKWVQSCRSRGLSAEQQMQEYQFRVAWVRFRRRVTDATVRWPEGYPQSLSNIARDEANTLAVFDKRVAKQFLNVIEGSKPSDILYADGMEAIKKPRAVYSPPIHDDHIDALRDR